jgi:hypothetical protein
MPRAGVARRVNGRQRELQRLGNRYFCFVDRPKGSVDIAVSVCFGDALAANFGSIPPTMWRQTMTEMNRMRPISPRAPMAMRRRKRAFLSL